MSNAVDGSRNGFDVQPDPNPYFAGLVTVKAYHMASKKFDCEARLYVTPCGGLELHTNEGAYPVRGAYSLLTDRDVVVESEEFGVDDSDEEYPRTTYTPVYVVIPKAAFNAARTFAQVHIAPHAEKLFTEVPAWEVQIQSWFVVTEAARERAAAMEGAA